MAKQTATPAFGLQPRGDQREQTLRYLEEYFEQNPDESLSVTVELTREGLRSYQRGRTANLGSVRQRPTKTRRRR